MHARGSSTNREAIELLSSIIQPQWIKNLSRIYRPNGKFLDGLRSYREELQKARWIEIPLTSIETRRKRGSIETNLSRICREADELDKNSFSRRKTQK